MILSIETFEMSERYGDERALELIKEAGFDGIDYTFYDVKRRVNPLAFDDYKERAAKIRRKLDDLGLVCNQAHAPFRVTYGMEKGCPEWIELERSIEFASILGAKIIVVHSITIPDSAKKQVDFDEYNLEFYKSLEPFCEKFNIKIGVENLFYKDKKHGVYVGKHGKPSEMNSFMSRLDKSHFAVCVDLGHAALVYEPHEYISELDVGLLGALHVQDTDYLGDRHMVPFVGSQDWEKITDALVNTGYEGDFALEVLKFLKPYPDEMLPVALKFCCDTGRYLISRIQAKRV